MDSAASPGIKTSELWVVIASTLISVLTTIGLISQAQAATLVSGLPTIVSYIATGAAIVTYIHSRGKLKQQWMGLVAAQQIAAMPARAQIATVMPDSPPAPSYAQPSVTNVGGAGGPGGVGGAGGPGGAGGSTNNATAI